MQAIIIIRIGCEVRGSGCILDSAGLGWYPVVVVN